MTGADGADIARAVLDGNSFMTLATADAAGVPWSSPVWFATVDHRELYWVSAPTSRHSRNLAERSDLAVTVFDSTQKPGEVQAVYMVGTAARVPDDALEPGLSVFSAASVRSGMAEWPADRVSGDARLRLYRATIAEHYILDPDAPTDARLAVTL